MSHDQIFQRASTVDLSQSEIAKPDLGGRAAGKQMFEPLHHPHHPEVMRLAPALIALKNARIAHLTTGTETCVELLAEGNDIQKPQIYALAGQGMY